MEGRWRGVAFAAWLLIVALAVGAAGCGEDDGGLSQLESAGTDRLAKPVRTADPLTTFAPQLEVAVDEPWRPMTVRWFTERSVLRFAEDEGCADRKIAVGHTLPEQWTPEFDWIYPKALGGWSWPPYYRNPFDASCELNFDYSFEASDLTRPHDPGARVEGIRPGEGFYLDLVDSARPGPQLPDGDLKLPVYAERTDEGDGGVRLTYWALFGMDGEPGRPDAREGDWQRIDVLLHDLGDGRFLPLEIDIFEGDPSPEKVADPTTREAPWWALPKVDGTHPTVRFEPVTHDPIVVRVGSPCDCVRWRSWETLAAARKQPWYGFGGAWGEVGSTDATTGPLGPHGHWPPPG